MPAMTTTAPSRRHPALSLLILVAVLVAYVYSWVQLVHHDPLNGYGTLVGVVLLVAAGPLPWRYFLPGWFVVIVLNAWLGTDQWNEGFSTGLALAYVIVASLAALILVARLVNPPYEDESKAFGGRRIIGLSGYAGAGKDTAAAALLEDGWKRIAVGDKIAELALRIDPPVYVSWTRHYSANSAPETKMQYVRLSNVVARHGWTKAKEFDAVRQLLQDLGAGVREVVDPDAWVTATMRDLPDGDLVFTSVRFPNEANAIKAAGGHIVRVQRPGVGPVNGHDTETAMDTWDFDAYVNNDDRPEDAGKRLRDTVTRLADATPSRA